MISGVQYAQPGSKVQGVAGKIEAAPEVKNAAVAAPIASQATLATR